MKLLVIMLALALAPTTVHADPPPPGVATRDARIVPALQGGVLVGFKIYAIRPDSRFAGAGFHNGDLIVRVDADPVTTEAGQRALHDKLVAGGADATVTVRRKDQLVTLTSKAR